MKEKKYNIVLIDLPWGFFYIFQVTAKNWKVYCYPHKHRHTKLFDFVYRFNVSPKECASLLETTEDKERMWEYVDKYIKERGEEKNLTNPRGVKNKFTERDAEKYKEYQQNYTKIVNQFFMETFGFGKGKAYELGETLTKNKDKFEVWKAKNGYPIDSKYKNEFIKMKLHNGTKS